MAGAATDKPTKEGQKLASKGGAADTAKDKPKSKGHNEGKQGDEGKQGGKAEQHCFLTGYSHMHSHGSNHQHCLAQLAASKLP
jgi:hypothetical protein